MTESERTREREEKRGAEKWVAGGAHTRKKNPPPKREKESGKNV